MVAIPTFLEQAATNLAIQDASVEFNVEIDSMTKKQRDVVIDDETQIEEYFDISASLATATSSDRATVALKLNFSTFEPDAFQQVREMYRTELATVLRTLPNLPHTKLMSAPSPALMERLHAYFDGADWRKAIASLTSASDLGAIPSQKLFRHIDEMLDAKRVDIQQTLIESSPCYWHPSAVDIAVRAAVDGFLELFLTSTGQFDDGKTTFEDWVTEPNEAYINTIVKRQWNSSLTLQYQGLDVMSIYRRNSIPSDSPLGITGVGRITPFFPFVRRFKDDTQFKFTGIFVIGVHSLPTLTKNTYLNDLPIWIHPGQNAEPPTMSIVTTDGVQITIDTTLTPFSEDVQGIHIGPAIAWTGESHTAFSVITVEGAKTYKVHNVGNNKYTYDDIDGTVWTYDSNASTWSKDSSAK